MSARADAIPGGPTVVPILGAAWGDDGAPLRELALRPVEGDDELFLLDTLARLGPTERASALLARCLVGAGPGDGASGLLARLTVGAREAALLQLRRLTLGDRIDAVMSCPAPDCGELMELELRVDDLLVPPDPDPRREHRIEIAVDDRPLVVSFRLPTTSDLAAVAEVSLDDPELGATELLRRCVLRVTRGGRQVPVDVLDGGAREAVSEAMADLDPQALVELELTCPACAFEFTVLFDAGLYVLQELDARAARLLEEVHLLALHYHWSERDILALPPQRRERYLELVAGRQAGSAHAAGYGLS